MSSICCGATAQNDAQIIDRVKRIEEAMVPHGEDNDKRK
jgi:hypothetical protein